MRTLILFGMMLLGISNFSLNPAISAEYLTSHDVFNMPLSELLNMKIVSDVASLFQEEDLVVGSTVSVITQDRMKQQGVRRLKDALENELSVMSNLTLGSAYTNSIRGYTKKTTSGVNILIDGMSIMSLSHHIPQHQVPEWMPGTLNRIEFIKGPGSAIYGSEAFHGVISLKTFESNKNYFRAGGAFASPSYSDGSFQFSRGFNQNRIRIDMSIGASGQGDQDLEYTFRDTIGIPDMGVPPASGTSTYKYKYDCQTGVLKLRFNPQNGIKAKLGYYGNRYDSERFPGSMYNAAGHNLRDWAYSMHNATMDIFSGSLSYQTGNDIIISAEAYYWESDLDGQYGLYKYPDLRDVYTFDTNTRSSATLMVKQEESGMNIQWFVAGSFTEQEIPEAQLTIKQVEGGAILADFEEIPYEDYSRQINSLYGQAKIGFFENKVYFLAGGRVDDYGDVGSQFTPRAGIIWQPNQKSAVKVLYGRAFNAPNGYGLRGNVIAYKGNEDIKPEIIDVYELVYLYRDEVWKFGLTGFYSNWKDGIVGEPFDDPEERYHTMYDNRGDNRAYGIEATLFRQIDVFAIDLGVSWVKSESLDEEDPYNPGKIIDMEYGTFPEYSILCGFYYTLMPYQIDFYLNNRFYMYFKAFSVDDVPNITGPPDDLDSYWRTDLTVSKNVTEKLKMYLNIRNLFDRDNHVASVLGTVDGLPEQGISGMLRMDYTF